MKYIYIMLISTLMMITTTEVQANEDPVDRMYSIVIDRFYNFDDDNNEGVRSGDKAYPFGGDFGGVNQYLDYVQEMGFNTIHLSPVLQHEADDYLGYAIESYEDIASAFGGGAEFSSLIDEIHNRDMKIVVDMPTTAIDDYTPTDDTLMSALQEEYFERFDIEVIDLTDESNIEMYRDMLQTFTETYPVDGISMFITQDGVDGGEFLPEDLDTYAITTEEGVEVAGFDHITTEEVRRDIAHGFHYFDNEILEYPSQSEEVMLLADHWFSDRFVYQSVEERAFPVTRVKQLSTYLLGYPGAISYYYGTEVAFNGNTLEDIHPQMNFWVDKEIVEHVKETSSVFKRFPEIFNSETETLLNESGHYVVMYHTVEDEPNFIFRINDSSRTIGMPSDVSLIGEGKMMSGLLTGEIARINNDDQYITVLDRETSELFAIIDNVGLNHWYLISSVLIFGGFAGFLFLVTRRSEKPKVK